MKIYLAIGLICLFSVSVFAGGWVTPRDDNRVPASVICDRDGNFLVIDSSGNLMVKISSLTVVEVYDSRYFNKVSTGTADKITATTSQQIVISNDVTKYQFTFINSADGSAEATVTSSIDGDKMYFYDGFWKVITVDVPQPITFDITMPVTSTFTYKITEVK